MKTTEEKKVDNIYAFLGYVCYAEGLVLILNGCWKELLCLKVVGFCILFVGARAITKVKTHVTVNITDPRLPIAFNDDSRF